MEISNVVPWIIVLLSFISALLISYLSVPPIVRLAKAKGLCALPNGRTSHEGAVPTLGGIAIFAGFKISALLFSSYAPFPELPYIAAACLLIFFCGLKDDIFIISPFSKIITQLTSAAIIIYFADIRLTNFHGFLGITEIPYVYSFILTMFVIIVIINSFNLIDGIDGLASAIGVICSFTFGIWFYLVGNYQYAILSVALAGALVGFLRFNLSNGPNKIFMGDTGSLLLGFVIAILAIKFNELNLTVTGQYYIEASPAVSIGILMLPLYDTLRVMVVRIMRRQSPFKADRGHIHHKLLDLNYTHSKATLILSISNIIFIFLAFYLRHVGILWLTLILFTIATLAYILPITVTIRRLKKALLSSKKEDQSHAIE
jgi:UDP-GlcNAc:undecaprenyl-phosphate GlcNAc-1-phosphate transferase